jgi:amino acid adenylation domain-containing protein
MSKDKNADALNACSLIQLLQTRAAQKPHNIAYIFLVDGEKQELHLSYGELDRQARVIAARLQALGLQGERGILLYPQGLDYIAAFFGCLYAGVIAVPAYPPRNKRHIPRLLAIIANCQAAVILSNHATAQTLHGLCGVGFENNLPVLETDNFTADTEIWRLPIFGQHDTAFLQYTSGSTGKAKGVMITHANLIANQNLIKEGFGHDQNSTVVGWLPFYHDMGLIGNIMQPLFIGAPAILMSPMAFLEKPFNWLQAISKYRAHTSGGPNFAFDLCVQKISDEEKSRLDLSSWQVAFNGSELIHAATLDRFVEAFDCCGFQRSAFYPCYGLAESTLLVTGGSKGASPRIVYINKTGLETNIASPGTIDKDGCRQLVSCGVAGRDHQVRIVDPYTQAVCGSGQVGEIQVSGASVAEGYWQNALATAESFVKDENNRWWLHTGDLGFIDSDELFVSGRLKDLIIIRGRNYYPHDIEVAASAAVSCINPGALVAFSVTADEQEKLVLVAELKRSYLKQIDFSAEFSEIRKRLVDECGLQADTVAFVKPGSILKTTSGKIRRGDCKKEFESQQLVFVGVDRLSQKSGIYLPVRDRIKQLPEPERMIQHQTLFSMPSIEATKLLTCYLSEKIQSLSGFPHEQMDLFASALSMGIDSLKAAELKYFIDDLLEINLPISFILDDKSIIELAEFALSLVSQKNNKSSCLVKDDKRAQGQVLSFEQQAIWMVCQLEANTVVYNLPLALRISSIINVEALRFALCILINRHEQLRTGYIFENGQPVQTLLPETEPEFIQIICRDEKDRRRKVVTEIYRPFNLEHDQKLKTALLSLADDDHVLLFCAHHIAVDFRSMVLLLNELKNIYAAKLTRQEVDLSVLTANYYDYINWQKSYLASEAAEQALDYWQQKLEGELPKLQIPSDKKISNMPSYHGNSETLTIDYDTTQKLQRLAKDNGVTLYMLLLAVFKVLLYRYSGQEDIIVGSPTIGRPKKRFSDLVGYFVNPVPIRTFPEGTKTFIGYLQEIKQTVLGALLHQDYPISLLVEKIQPERATGISPFYRVCFALQGDTVEGEDSASLVLGMPDILLDWPELNARTIKLPETVAHFDINLMMAVVGNQLSASFQYSSELFKQQTIVGMIGHFQCLLQGVLENPFCELSLLPILMESDRHRQMVEWNSVSLKCPKDLCLHQLFESQVAKAPEAIAAMFEGKEISYSVLNNRANQLAHYLRAHGVGAEVLVGICVNRSLDMIVGLLGILKAGGAYVPLDPDYPKERLKYTLGDANPVLVLTEQCLVELLPDGYSLLCLDTDRVLLEPLSIANLENVASPNNIAYVIYTSGSTGKPKGVAVTHHNVRRLFAAAEPEFTFSSSDVWSLFHSYAFDFSVWELWGALLYGGKLVVVPYWVSRCPATFHQLLHEHRVTILNQTPSSFYQLAAVDKLQGTENILYLRCVIFGGEALETWRLHEWFDRHTDNCPKLVNMYGITETTVHVTQYSLVPGKDSNNTSSTIGRPLRDLQIFIFDTRLNSVPIGVAGEIYVGGAGLARGYLYHPELTAERFLPHPNSPIPGDRLYRTGDLGRFRSDGVIEYLGRNDTQVKIRGFRIEIGEIESRLLQHTAIKEVVVLANEAQQDDKRLIAYLVATMDHQPDIVELKAFLKQTLPDYMVPAAFIFLTELPLTANGKLDRKSLLSMSAQGEQRREYIAPRDDAEQAIAEIWQKILGVEKLGIYDDFFDLGGHSLSAVQIIAKIQENFAITVPVKTLFEAPTIAEFVDRIVEFQEE